MLRAQDAARPPPTSPFALEIGRQSRALVATPWAHFISCSALHWLRSLAKRRRKDGADRPGGRGRCAHFAAPICSRSSSVKLSSAAARIRSLWLRNVDLTLRRGGLIRVLWIDSH